MKEIRANESGQAMAEFALVLPMLALLTFGTLAVTIYLQQQSMLNGAAFLAARAGSVVGNQVSTTRESVSSFAQAAGAGWLQDAVGSMKNGNTAELTQFRMQSKTDNLSGMIAALSGQSQSPFDTIASQATLPMEYNAKKHGQRSITGKPVTHFKITYDSKAIPLPPVDKAKTNIDRIGGFFAKIPKVPGFDKLNSAVDQVAGFKVGGEPFESRGAIMPNPKHRNDSGDGSQLTSSQYLSPKWETMQGNGYRIETITTELAKYEDSISGKSAGLKDACQVIGEFPKGVPVPPAPPAAAALVTLKAAVAVAKKAAAPWTKAIGDGAGNTYTNRKQKEKNLF